MIGILLNHSNGLWTGYTQLSSITSSGTQYINTGVSLANGYRIVAHMNFKKQSTVLYTFFLAQNGGSPYGAVGCRETNPRSKVQILLGNDGAGTTTAYGDKTIELIAQNGASSVKVNGSTISSGSFPTTISAFPLFIFAEGTAGNPDRFSSTTLYSFDIYDENDVLVRSFVPAMRNKDSEIGLLDIVGRKFYTNQGTGTFT